MAINLDKLNNLSDSEKKVALDILKEFAKTGSSKTYAELIYKDYKEIPVDIETFLTDDKYLGKAWKDAEGKVKLYPFWLDELKDIFPDNINLNYDTLLESGARGIGKSEVACGCIGAYLMYRLMCLKDPLEHYHIKNTEKIAFAFMNIKLDLAEAIAMDKFQKTIQKSPWFMAKGSMTQRNNQPYWNPPAPIEIIIGSQSDDVIGRPIYFCFADELSFLKNQDIDKQKERAKNMINTAKGGMKTRFIYKGKNPTLLVVASSKRSEQSFMESYIRELSQDEGDNVKIIDEPVWKVKPSGTYSDKMFLVGLGNRYLDNIVIPREDYNNLTYYFEKGYNIIEMPIDFEKDARNDLNRVLCDYAGISSFSSNKFMSAGRVAEVVDKTLKNPFPDVIECGNSPDDDSQYSDWFDMTKIPREYMGKPLFIHLDMSLSGDKTGIAGVWIIGKNPGKDLLFRPAFSTSIKAPKGRQVSFAKNRAFIRWLKEQGFRIREITSDTFQSADLQQQMSAEGFTCSILSVDRVEKGDGERVGICKPYHYLRNTIYEKRIILYNTELLYNELVQLEINNNNGKIDHPDNGKTGSKDQADALCGAVFTASKYAEEYAHDYGEDAELTLFMNDNHNDMREQVTVNLQDELMKMREYLNPKNIDEGFEHLDDLIDVQAFNNDILLPM